MEEFKMPNFVGASRLWTYSGNIVGATFNTVHPSEKYNVHSCFHPIPEEHAGCCGIFIMGLKETLSAAWF